MKVKYIGPHDEVELPDGKTVKRNHQVEVDDDLAGHAPPVRLGKAMDELHEAIESHDHPGVAKLREEITALDDGTGLLAQYDNWERVTPKAKDDDK